MGCIGIPLLITADLLLHGQSHGLTISLLSFR